MPGFKRMPANPKMIKNIFLIIICCFFVIDGASQMGYSNIDSKLKYNSDPAVTDIFCNGSSFYLQFRLGSKSVKLDQGFLLVDSQVIQIALLRIDGPKKTSYSLTPQEQHNILSAYSKYELDYFTHDLKTEVINPDNQWIDTKSGKWLVWYFRVGDDSSVQVYKKTVIQLFASKIIGDMILDINAPISEEGDFKKAGLIVNELMESLTTKSEQ